MTRDHDLAEIAAALVREGERPEGVFARVVAERGFGGGRAAGVLYEGPGGRRIGHIPGEPTWTERSSEPVRLEEITVRSDDAVAAGLSCGGSATVLVHRAELVPGEVWGALSRGEPAALVSELTGGAILALLGERTAREVVSIGSLGDEALDEQGEALGKEALRAGRSHSRLDEERGLAVEAFFPPTTLVVVGSGDLADALVAQGGLLGWDVAVVPAWAEAEPALGALGRSDAAIVLSHDPQLDARALALALRAGCYVGALGSRHTQAARRERLSALEVAPDDVSRVHGPAGLDLGSRTPEETAVSIVAEILAHRSGRSAASLFSSDGPIHG